MNAQINVTLMHIVETLMMDRSLAANVTMAMLVTV
jgi:hypothetical protein